MRTCCSGLSCELDGVEALGDWALLAPSLLPVEVVAVRAFLSACASVVEELVRFFGAGLKNEEIERDAILEPKTYHRKPKR